MTDFHENPPKTRLREGFFLFPRLAMWTFALRSAMLMNASATKIVHASSKTFKSVDYRDRHSRTILAKADRDLIAGQRIFGEAMV